MIIININLNNNIFCLFSTEIKIVSSVMPKYYVDTFYVYIGSLFSGLSKFLFSNFEVLNYTVLATGREITAFMSFKPQCVKILRNDRISS